MLVGEDVDLGPFVLKEKLLAGISDCKIISDELLSIRSSPLGGCGLFYKPLENTTGFKEDFEVLRIPQGSTLDYMTLLAAFEEAKSRDADCTSPKPRVLESEVIRAVLICAEPESETDILIAYIIAFHMLRKILVKDTDYFLGSRLRQYDWYIDVLSSVKTMACPPSQDIAVDQPSSKFLFSLARDFEELEFKYQNFVESIRDDFSGWSHDANSIIPFQVWSQLHLAVRSRTLEVPHRISGEMQESTDSDTLETSLKTLAIDEAPEDFTTNITLVPVLDFANHKNPCNAYFDVDADLGDIILKVKGNQVASGESEITISYSPVECILQFVTTYGFAPQYANGLVQVFEYPIENLDNWLPHGETIAKWLQILPRVQLIKHFDKCVINLGDSPLPLLLCGKLTLDTQWPENSVDSTEMIEAMIYQRDSADCEFIIGSDHIPVMFDGSHIEDIDTISELTAIDREALSAKCSELILEQMRRDLAKLKISITHDPSAFSEMSRNYNIFLEKFIENALKEGISLSAQGDNSEWLLYRPPPRCIDI